MNLQSWLGLIRSIIVYRVDPVHKWRLRRFYKSIATAGDLVFDVGAHVGDRINVFTAMGCRVVGVEPQTSLMRVLHFFYGKHRDVKLEACALGAAPGMTDILISPRNPTVSSLSPEWVDRTGRESGFRKVVWNQRQSVTVATLDELIARHGLPHFCKIDVEGFETEVLRGLTQAIPLLSFEFLVAQRDLARTCLAEIARLGRYSFNISYDERLRFVWTEWCSGEDLARHLDALPASVRSGDIYARFEATAG